MLGVLPPLVLVLLARLLFGLYLLCQTTEGEGRRARKQMSGYAGRHASSLVREKNSFDRNIF